MSLQGVAVFGGLWPQRFWVPSHNFPRESGDYTGIIGDFDPILSSFHFFFFFKTPTAPGLPKESPIPKQARPRLASEIRRDRMRSGWRGR